MSFLRSPRFWLALFLGVGLFASTYLLFEYVTGGPITCGTAAGCEIVRASKWAYVGSIPRPLFGVVFYMGMLALLVTRAVTPWQEVWLRRLTFIGALIGLAESIHLFFIQLLSIGTFCTWCIASGVATIGAFVFACLDRGTLSKEQRLRDLEGYTAVILLLVVLGVPGFLVLTR